MNTPEFNKIVQERCLRIEQILHNKAAEYAHGDRLSNFKRAAEMLHSTPERALLGMAAKHAVSVIDLIEDLDGDRFASLSAWQEKIGDLVNYLILLEALIIERATHPDLPAIAVQTKHVKSHRR